MNWSRILCGGAGWTENARRRAAIDTIKMNLEMWRDFDNPAYLARAREVMREL